MDESRARLAVEFTLTTATMKGMLPLPVENRRLVDMLNGAQAEIELEDVVGTLRADVVTFRFEAIVVRKADVLYAIPHETESQLRHRAMSRTGIAAPRRDHLPFSVLLPGCHIVGIATIPPGSHFRQVDASIFPHFFPLTEAVVTQADGISREESVVIVNRDALQAWDSMKKDDVTARSRRLRDTPLGSFSQAIPRAS